jgi:hypothetical protein
VDALRLLDAGDGRPGDPSILDEALRRAGLRRRPPRIRCPRCRWRPRRGDRWLCTWHGCGTSWNTFETRGRCPGCGHQWTDTCCLACHRWSRHLDWYEPGDGAAPDS